MSKLGVQNPISAGQVVGSYDATSIANTDWHTLTSSDFYNPITGDQYANGLKFAFVNMTNSSANIAHLKLRAADGAGDGKTNTDGVIFVPGIYQVDSQALQDSDSITSIAYAKGGNSDKVVIEVGFNK
jgi:hypothetical protein